MPNFSREINSFTQMRSDKRISYAYEICKKLKRKYIAAINIKKKFT